MYQARENELLFSKRDWFSVEENQKLTMISNINEIDGNKLLNISVDDLCDYYEQKYGVIPEFKAGVNVGHVTVAEVGEIKKELAYHGDALNTAARIRSLCGSERKRLLVSEALTGMLTGLEEAFLVESIGGTHLKGKEGTVNLLSVEAR